MDHAFPLTCRLLEFTHTKYLFLCLDLRNFSISFLSSFISFTFFSPLAFDLFSCSPDLQTVNIKLRVLFRPRVDRLAALYRELGTDYADRVLPSIVNETLKSVVAQVCVKFRLRAALACIISRTIISCLHSRRHIQFDLSSLSVLLFLASFPLLVSLLFNFLIVLF
jgi:hypothetical protein